MAMVVRCDVCGGETAALAEGWGFLSVQLSRALPTGDDDRFPVAGSRTLDVCQVCCGRAQAGLAVVDLADVAMVLIRAAAMKEGPDA